MDKFFEKFTYDKGKNQYETNIDNRFNEPVFQKGIFTPIVYLIDKIYIHIIFTSLPLLYRLSGKNPNAFMI